MKENSIPYLKTDNKTINHAFRIAVGDLAGNISLFKDGLLEKEVPVILAGLDYDTPWTRDAAFNVWNGAGVLSPEVSRNTLLSVLKKENGKTLIGGQYWDAIIWTIGAWSLYLYTGDREFLKTAFEAVANSLEFFEDSEFDSGLGLFRGAACYGDGISAYPDVYSRTTGTGCILDWVAANPDKSAVKGYGIPMHSLSTNCLYYKAYVVANLMAKELGSNEYPAYLEKAEALKCSINENFWDEEMGNYKYLVDPLGDCDHQEGLGSSFAILFGIADEVKREKIFRNQHVNPAGIPCVWPTFKRYETPDGMSFGRHSGTVWPHIQAFWAHASAMHGEVELFASELYKMAEHAVKDEQFLEIYHPLTEERYGGKQEYIDYKSCGRQTWCATGFIRLILMGLLGMRFSTGGISFKPVIPRGISEVRLENLSYRDMVLNISIKGQGTSIKRFMVNGLEMQDCIIRSGENGIKEIQIDLA